MKFAFPFIVCVVILLGCETSSSQTPLTAGTTIKKADEIARTTPAFAEVVLKETEMASELEALLIDYTDDFPKVKELRFGISLAQKNKTVLLAVKPADAPKLTLALGKLIVRKVEVEIDLWKLQQNYADGHPDVKRAKKKVEIFEKAIKEILG